MPSNVAERIPSKKVGGRPVCQFFACQSPAGTTGSKFAFERER
jgi:hypothetical protein